MLLPPTRLLVFKAVEIAAHLRKARNGGQYVIKITERYTKLPRAFNTSISYVATILVDHLVVPYEIQSLRLIGNEPQFVAKLFKKLRIDLKVKDSTTTAYHPWTNGQIGRYNKTLVAR